MTFSWYSIALFSPSSIPSLFPPSQVDKAFHAPVSSPPTASTCPNSGKTATVNPPALVDALDGSCRGSAEEVSQLRCALALAGYVEGPGFEQKRKAWVRCSI